MDFDKLHIQILCFLGLWMKIVFGAELAIQIPENLSQDNSTYRLDYVPKYGHPPPNTTILSRDIGHVIQFSKGLPGTKYEFWLYYSNTTLHDWLTWTASITTAPDPPSNLTVTIRNGRSAVVNFSPPVLGSYHSFKMKVISLAEPTVPTRTILLNTTEPYTLRELTPGGSYQLQLFTVFDQKESVAYTSRNFTTKPNTPGKFIVWFRNETTLLVLWQPSYPASIYTHYIVRIDPPDAAESMLYVEKEGEPPGPAQAAFKALIPGRAYNISVQTMSEDEISTPTVAQYRTIPLRPINVRFDKSTVTSHSFTVLWDSPNRQSEFDKYQISINLRRQGSVPPITRNRSDPTFQTFKEGLEPGQTYHVLVKTVSGKVTSWPVAVNVTLKPLPVEDLKAENSGNGVVVLSWKPQNSSTQDQYKISYTEMGVLNGDTNTMYTENTQLILESLLPGRKYSIAVQAVSNQQESHEKITYQSTRPSAPVIEDLRPIEYGLNISWKSDVNSRQEKYEVIYHRNDSDGEPKHSFTTEPHLLLTNLYPGAGYEIKVFAISHSLYSEPHDYFQAVFPKPPTNLTMENVTSNSVVVRWMEPIDSLFSDFSIRYRTEDDSKWIKLPTVRHTEAEVADLTPGEKYTIQVNTVSFGVESANPLTLHHTVRPNPVTAIAPLVDSTNVTLEFPRPEGKIEYYIINWVSVDESDDDPKPKTRNMTGFGSEGGTVRALVEDLMPGIKYQFDIHTVSYNLHSDITTLTARTMPLILSEVLVVNNQQATDTVTLRYTPTPQSSSHFDKYRFSLSGSGAPVIREKDANDTEWKVTFTSLTPGKLYNITLWTVADHVLSQPLHRQDRLYPEPITQLNATNITGTTVTLTWDKPRGEYNAFEVQYLNTEELLIQNLTQEKTFTVTDLKPYRNYTFTVVVRSGMEATILRRSLPISAVFTTHEGIPGLVTNFHPKDIQPSEIHFMWILPPSEQNGIIRKFTITYGLENSVYTQRKDFKPWETEGTIRNLMPGKTYIFHIQGETKVGYGREAIWKQTMPILAPPKPSPQVVPTEVCRTSTTIQIRFRKNYFSEANGPVVAYTIIVAEDDTKNASGIEMPGWRDVQAYSVWPPYQVIEPYFPFKNASVVDFTIGTEDCETKMNTYCNGPLKGGTTYRVKIRAFTAPEKFTDTHYSFSIQTDQNTTPLIVGITIPSVVLLILFIVILLMRRNKIIGRRPTENRASDNLSIQDSIMETTRPIRLENFAEHYRIMSADSDFRFSEEFEELKHVGREQPCTFADLPCNRPKNRFTNILPYDHSRFKLQPVDDEEGSDYINANYVPGFHSPREFIVTQGPLHSTRDDFWRMCWESNSRAIVMLTRCIEKGREKCDHYWPYDTMPVYYGDISVTILNDSHYPDWSVTEFIMARGDTQRVIRHFHFTTWPDFGVPNPPTTLVRFVRAFRERIAPEQRPIVVHCSAGVGRSGTFIALDRIVQSLNHGADTVDIFGIVWQMRKERVWMVQTEQQYICIHQCLLAVLQGDDNQAPPREIHHNPGFEDDEGIAESGM
ncbi:tyrosine-protein phosphatase 10D isoform X2 [Cimex lectularius]|uniref:protein-tyrosine-phosphatase n=1 Tax=Cimex lectularius TaxID=79782 RepID=A0A8I6R9B6_CIMLE|nr:tyrosine-protein phosphatase 10D isoform X2 [Cimex lectularius]